MHKSSSSTASVPEGHSTTATTTTSATSTTLTNSKAALDGLITPTGQWSGELPTVATSDFAADSVTSRVTTRSVNYTTTSVSNRTIRLVNQFVCLCGKLCPGRVGLSSHQRSCVQFRRIVLGPLGPIEGYCAN